MRSLLFVSALIIVALAVDAWAFGGQYRRSALREANYQTQQFAYKVAGYFRPSID
jgi:hypothetical protein